MKLSDIKLAIKIQCNLINLKTFIKLTMGNEAPKQGTRYRNRTLQPRKNFSIDANLKYDRQQFQRSSVALNNKLPSTERDRKRSFNSTPYDDSVYKVSNEPKSPRQIKGSNQKSLNNSYLTIDAIHTSPLNLGVAKKGGQQKDRILANLSRKNEELRRQLKQINQQLTQKLKKKKLVPKKKKEEQEEQNPQLRKQVQAKSAGLKRELQNGFKQIDMYKRTLQQLNAKQQVKISQTKVKQLQNQVAQLDRIINETIKKLDGMKNVRKNQERTLGNDINQQLIDNLDVLKKEEEEIKLRMKEIKRKDQQRENNFKKQQAYLFEVQKKYRQLTGQYFPDLKKKVSPTKQSSRKASTSPSKKQSPDDVLPSAFQVNSTLRELNDLREKHQKYHKKIDAQLKIKNNTNEELETLEKQVTNKDKIIETLKIKLKQMRKIIRPNKKSLFGYDSYEGSDLQSQYGGASQAQKQIHQQHQQDQFDIKHLIANIPKPIRLKPVEMEVNNSIRSGGSLNNSIDGKGMVITGEKSQPKVWGNMLTRKQEKGKFFKNELTFDDTAQFQNSDAQPLIIGINGWLNKNGDILALQAIYLNGGEIRYGVKSSANADGFIVRYDLQSPDYLKNVIGGFGQGGVLQHIAFYSKKGKSGTFGNKRDYQESFTFGLANNQRPFRFNGATFMIDAQPRLCRIGIEICAE